MKIFFKITLFLILTIILLSSGINGHDIYSLGPDNSLLGIRDDTTDLKRFIGVESFKLTILPPSSGVQFYKDGIVFLSLSKYEKEMSPAQISFGTAEAYYAAVTDSVLGKHTIFSPFSSFSYPCEAMTFSKDFNTIYFTKIPKKEKKEKIFIAKVSANSKNQMELVPEIAPLDFCTGNYNYSHPTLSSDEKMLVFASDREGSLGGMDLFVSRFEGGKWSVPENLGKQINTFRNEFFPFLDKDNNLYFSSDGLPGDGGYDIFTSKFNGSGWDKPINLTDRINSKDDDIAFTINKTDGKTAFFTRRQKSVKGDMQLYMVTLRQEVADLKIHSLSYVFNGMPVPVKSLLVASREDQPSEKDSINTKPLVEVIKKEESKVPENAAGLKKKPDKVTISKTEPAVKQAEAKVMTEKPSITAPSEQKNVVIYRIQFLTSNNHKNQKEIILNGKSYNPYEYFYLGAYRYTIGEFTTLLPAVELQKICRQSGYPQAFIVAFKNNARSLDPKLFK